MPSPRFRLIPPLATTLGFSLLMVLGTWQYRRAGEKSEMERARDASATLPPTPITSATALTEALAFHTVRTRATLDRTRVVSFKHRTRDGHPGLWFGAPLILEDGSSVWANLGWVPIGQRDAISKKLRDTPTSAQAYQGLWHVPSRNIDDTVTRALLLKTPNLLSQETTAWRTYDIEALHDTLQSPKPTRPGVVVLTKEHSGTPFPIASTSYIPKPYMTSERHMSYSAFWYVTGLALLALYLGYTFGFIGSFGHHRKRTSQA